MHDYDSRYEEAMQDGYADDWALAELITEGLDHVEDPELEIRDVERFDHAGVMTYNAGLVIRLADGSEYQVTIVRSR